MAMPRNREGAGAPADPRSSAARSSVEILAPTALEYWAVRSVLPGSRTHRAGVALSRWRGAPEASPVVVCGLAGGLAPRLSPGTLVVPEQVILPDGTSVRCDPELVAALAAGARALGFPPETGPLLTASSIVIGDARRDWARRGCVAADMETGLLGRWNVRLATVRVILDSPGHSISDRWLKPAQALLRPALWQELWWLGRFAPFYSIRAARVLRAGLERWYRREEAGG